MIYLIAGEKGGTAKTTMAVNLALHLHNKSIKTALIDADPKPDGYDFFKIREELHSDKSSPHVRKAQYSIDLVCKQLKREGFTCVVDLGGFESDEIKEVMSICDTVLIPFAPTRLDINTAKNINRIIGNMKLENRKLKAFCCLVKCPTHYLSSRRKEKLKRLSDYEHLEQIDTSTKYRESWMVSGDDGLSIEELTDNKAKAEFQLIMKKVIGDE